MTKEILAVDPGKRNGWAILKFGGACDERGIVGIEDWPDFLATLRGRPFHRIVVEEYRVFRRLANAQSGSTVESAQSVGMVKSFAALEGIGISMQQPGARLLGAKFVQFAVKKSHMDDDISAWLHGIFYLEQINQLTTALERRLQNGD